MPHDLEKWRDVADANGGLDLTTMKPSEAGTLVTALRYTAERELPRLADTDLASEDGSYTATACSSYWRSPSISRG